MFGDCASNLRGRIWLHVFSQKDEAMSPFIEADCSYIAHIIVKPTTSNDDSTETCQESKSR
jgi:hypothetical protein